MVKILGVLALWLWAGASVDATAAFLLGTAAGWGIPAGILGGAGVFLLSIRRTRQAAVA